MKPAVHARSRQLLCQILALSCVAALGCEQSSHVDFVLNTEGALPLETQIAQKEQQLSDQLEGEARAKLPELVDEERIRLTRQQEDLRYALAAMFGTPDDPFAPPSAGFNIDQLRRAAGPTGGKDVQVTDAEGNVTESYHLGGLYREHCVHCHGITGDGAGPTARFLDPYPRDYRNGTFKYTMTKSKEKPTLDDLTRTLTEGLHGTMMPPFGVMLTKDEINALVQYVKYLSVRGEVEIYLQRALDGGATIMDEEGKVTPETMNEQLESVLDSWNNVTVVPAAPREIEFQDMTPEQQRDSIEQGRILFETKGQCIKCHGPAGLGDGGQINYDDWNKDKAEEKDLEIRAEKWTLPLQELKARNLQWGVYRGGRRPIDIYHRIRWGITGTPMPAASIITKEEQAAQEKAAAEAAAAGNAAPAADQAGAAEPTAGTTTGGQEAIVPQSMTEEEIWRLVDYVLSLPYERGFRTETTELSAPNAK